MSFVAHPAPPRCRLFVAKDEHKFSCAHMTMFPDGTKERLHGHNFRVAASVELAPGAKLLDFAQVKAVLAGLCAELREHLLVPADHPAVRVVRRDDTETELVMGGCRYVLPSDELMMLPVENVVVEQLAQYLWSRIMQELGDELIERQAVALEVTVTEGPGQGASYQAPVVRAFGGR